MMIAHVGFRVQIQGSIRSSQGIGFGGGNPATS